MNSNGHKGKLKSRIGPYILPDCCKSKETYIETVTPHAENVNSDLRCT